MNWLLYIPGWFLGWALFNDFVLPRENYNDAILVVKLVIWTMLWVWICWKFIA